MARISLPEIGRIRHSNTISMRYSRTFFSMALANMFTTASISSFFLFPLFIMNHGGSRADIGIMMAVFTLASIMSRPWISEMIDRIGYALKGASRETT